MLGEPRSAERVRQAVLVCLALRQRDARSRHTDQGSPISHRANRASSRTPTVRWTFIRPDGARGENELDQDFAQQGLFTCFRLYGSYFDKTWMLADIEEVK
jgi:hypothetical protein